MSPSGTWTTRLAGLTPGRWRLFLQFQTGGRVHTAAFTLNA
jgi:hypothetical protein